jgi:RNA polymerase sigma factor (sigma-70 family)
MVNLVIDRVRREKVAQAHRQRVAVRSHSEDPVGDEVRLAEAKRLVEKALARLPPEHRAIWEDRQKGMTNKEIADKLGSTVDAVKQTYSRCQMRLYGALSGHREG